MGWNETHEYYRILRVVEAELDERRDGVLPWHDEYAAAFRDARTMRLALRRRWSLLVEAQVELAFTRDGRPTRELRDVARAHPGLLHLVVADEARWRPLLVAPPRPAQRARCLVWVVLGRGPASVGSPVRMSA